MIMRFALVALFVLCLLPSASALEPVPGWNSTCVDSNTLLKRADIYLNDTLYAFNQSITCNYGCDTQRDVCWKWPGQAIPGEYYLTFIIFALVLLVMSLLRLDTKKNDIKPSDLAFALIAMGLFFILALQGNNVIDMSTGEAVQIPMLVQYCFGFGGLSIVIFVFNFFKFLGKEVEG